RRPAAAAERGAEGPRAGDRTDPLRHPRRPAARDGRPPDARPAARPPPRRRGGPPGARDRHPGGPASRLLALPDGDGRRPADGGPGGVPDPRGTRSRRHVTTGTPPVPGRGSARPVGPPPCRRGAPVAGGPVPVGAGAG